MWILNFSNNDVQCKKIYDSFDLKLSYGHIRRDIMGAISVPQINRWDGNISKTDCINVETKDRSAISLFIQRFLTDESTSLNFPLTGKQINTARSARHCCASDELN